MSWSKKKLSRLQQATLDRARDIIRQTVRERHPPSPQPDPNPTVDQISDPPGALVRESLDPTGPDSPQNMETPGPQPPPKQDHSVPVRRRATLAKTKETNTQTEREGPPPYPQPSLNPTSNRNVEPPGAQLQEVSDPLGPIPPEVLDTPGPQSPFTQDLSVPERVSPVSTHSTPNLTPVRKRHIWPPPKTLKFREQVEQMEGKEGPSPEIRRIRVQIKQMEERQKNKNKSRFLQEWNDFQT